MVLMRANPVPKSVRISLALSFLVRIRDYAAAWPPQSKTVVGTFHPEFNPEKVHLFVAKLFIG